jgi:hypothetical protein
MCDADLDALGRDDYMETALRLRAELAGDGLRSTLNIRFDRYFNNHIVRIQVNC